MVFELISLYPFDLQFSRDEPWRGPFYVMKFFFFPPMYEVYEIYLLRFASGTLALILIVFL